MQSWQTGGLSDRCPACGSMASQTLFHSTDLLYRTTRESFAVVRCTPCGLSRLSPPIPAAQLHRYYPETYWFVPDTFSQWEEAYRRFVLRDHLQFTQDAYRRAGGCGAVLDAGCGGGLFPKLLAQRGIEVFGMDNSLHAVSAAWQVNRVPALCGTLADAPLREGSCAVITMFHVVEHLGNPVAHLTAARRLLRPNGRLVVQVPNADCWQVRLFGRRWNGFDVPRHLIDYRARDLISLLEACGFRVERIRFFNLRDNPAGFATSFAPWLDPMARRLTGPSEQPALRMLRNLTYLALTAAAVPFAWLEAMFRQGSSVMVEASVDERAA